MSKLSLPSQPPLGCRRGSCMCCSVAVSDLCMNGPAPCMLTSYRHRVTAVCFHNVFCECGSRSVQWQSAAVSLSEGCRKCFSWGLNLWWLLNTPHLKWWTKITAGQKLYLRAFAVWGYWSQSADVLQGHGFILALGKKILICIYSYQQPASAQMNYHPQIICSSAWFLSRKRSKEAFKKLKICCGH